MISLHPLLLFSSLSKSQRSFWPDTRVLISSEEMRLQVEHSTTRPHLPTTILSNWEASVRSANSVAYFSPSYIVLSVWAHGTYCWHTFSILSKLCVFKWEILKPPKCWEPPYCKNAVNVRWCSLQFVQQTASRKSNFSASLSLGVLTIPYFYD